MGRRGRLGRMTANPRVTVWNEYRHERSDEAVRRVYPNGIHEAVAEPLRAAGLSVTTATLDQPEHGLDDATLDATDVLFWWGHLAHGEVSDAVADKVVQRVLNGMGLVVLHSGHFSKVFKRLMGTACDLQWREGDRERLFTVAPGHPIAQGLPARIELGPEEMYGEPFDVPPPETLVFIGWFAGGEVFRSGCTYTRGNGRVFYFQPGHETNPTYHHPDIQKVLVNAARWAAPQEPPHRQFGHVPPAETPRD